MRVLRLDAVPRRGIESPGSAGLTVGALGITADAHLVVVRLRPAWRDRPAPRRRAAAARRSSRATPRSPATTASPVRARARPGGRLGAERAARDPLRATASPRSSSRVTSTSAASPAPTPRWTRPRPPHGPACCGPHLRGQGRVVVRRAAVPGDPVVDLLALGVAHQADHVAGQRLADQRGERRHLGGVRREAGHADPGGAGAHQRVELLDASARAGSAALCPMATTSLSRAAISPSFSISSSVRSPTAPRPSSSRAARAAYAVHDLEQRLEPGLVVGQVDDDRDLADGEEVHPARVVLGVRDGRCAAPRPPRRGRCRPPAPPTPRPACSRR